MYFYVWLEPNTSGELGKDNVRLQAMCSRIINSMEGTSKDQVSRFRCRTSAKIEKRRNQIVKQENQIRQLKKKKRFLLRLYIR